MAQLPTPYLFEFSHPVVVYYGRILVPSSTSSSQKLELGSKSLSLEEGISIRELEEMYRSHHSDAIDTIKQEFIENELRQSFLSREIVDSALRDNRTLSFIINDILPILTSNSLDSAIDDALTDTRSGSVDYRAMLGIRSSSSGSADVSSRELNQAKREAERRVKSDYQQYERRRAGRRDDLDVAISYYFGRPQAGWHNDGSVFSEYVIGSKNIMILNSNIYTLYPPKELLRLFSQEFDRNAYDNIIRMSDSDPRETADFIESHPDVISHQAKSRIVNKLAGSRLTIDDNYYIPLLSSEGNEIKIRYSKLIERELKLEAIEENQFRTAQYQMMQQERETLANLATRRRFEHNGAGFEKAESGYYVYATTPEYALKSPHTGTYFRFGKAKVGVRIESYNGSFDIRGPIVLNRYSHPFLYGNREKQSICLGAFDSSNFSRLRPAEKVQAMIAQGIKTLMMGYRSGSSPHHELGSGFRSISKQEIERRKIPVLNESMVNEYVRGGI